ncbi:hypothetical protein, partial [Christiangramia antarctica]
MIWKTTISFIAALFFSLGIYAQFSCPQENGVVTNVEFRNDKGEVFTEGYEPIDPVIEGQIFATFGGSTSNSYALNVRYNVYVNDVLVMPQEVCLFLTEKIPQGDAVYIGDFDWTWGDKLEIRDIFMRWKTGQPKLDNTECASFDTNKNSQCYANPGGFIVKTPLVPNFSYTQECNSKKVIFTDLTTGGDPPVSGYTYEWFFKNEAGTNVLFSKDDQYPTYEFSPSGTYEVTLASSDGILTKEITKTVEVFEPGDASISYTDPLCTNSGSATVNRTGVAGGEYSSSSSNLIINTSTGEIDLANTTEGTYTITYGFNANGCDYSTSTSVTISTPSVIISNDNGLDLTCENDSTTLTASGGVSYLWSDGTSVIGTNALLKVSTAGTFTVTATAANGCTGTAFVIIKQDNTPVVADISGNKELNCETKSIILDATTTGNV